LLILAGTPLAAQFVSRTSLVEVYATVTDASGAPVTGLTAADFQVEDDGVPQRIAAFAAGNFPLSVALAIDRSFSMRGSRLALAKDAARAFLAALEAGDQVMAIAIGSEVEIVAPLTTDHATVRGAIERLDPWGTTPLYDATLAALDAVQQGTGRRALVLVSDGSDRYSTTTAAELVEASRRRDVLIYPVAIGGSRPTVFAELSTVTGGRTVFAKDPRDLPLALTSVARELRQQYLLGYAPPEAAGADERWHSIRVTVRRPDSRVRARDGYFAR